MLPVLLALVVGASHAAVCRPHRDVRGHISRSSVARRVFRATHPCPRTGETTSKCQGYVIDHVCPLACCGADSPSNMQWQTTAEAKAKDLWELDCSSCAH